MDQIQQAQIKCSNHTDKQATHLFVSPPFSFITVFTCDICAISDEYQTFTKFALSVIMEEKKDYIIKGLPYLSEPDSLKQFAEKVKQLKSDQSARQEYYKSIEDLIHSYTNDLIEAMQEIKKIYLSKQDLFEPSEFYDFYFQISQREKLKNIIQNTNDQQNFNLFNFFFQLHSQQYSNQQILKQKLEILNKISQKKDINLLKKELQQIVNGVKNLADRLKTDLQVDNISQNNIQQKNQNNQIIVQQEESKQDNSENLNIINIIDNNTKQTVNQNIIDKNNNVQQQLLNYISVNDNLNQNYNNIINKNQNIYYNDNNFQVENKLNFLCQFDNQKENNNHQPQPIQFKRYIQTENINNEQNTYLLQEMVFRRPLQTANNGELQKNNNYTYRNKSMNHQEPVQCQFAKVISKNKNNTNQQMPNQVNQFRQDQMLQINQNNQDKINKNNNHQHKNNTQQFKQTIIQQREEIIEKKESNGKKIFLNTQQKILQDIIKMSLIAYKQNYLGKLVLGEKYKILSQIKEEEIQIGAIDCIINKDMINQKIKIIFQFQKTSMFQAIGLINQELLLKQKNRVSFLEDCQQQNLISNKGLCALKQEFVEFQFESNQTIEITFKENEIKFYNRTTKKGYNQKFSFQEKTIYRLGFILSGQSQLQII
ncbi:hypothetical protein TTHERM_00191610 (macronuclear) [Tetrahymena thermophila SB210]|uniref:Uncharacterized protein n=1 Tax=Tetrahymena thermophila (strain SB210) TaxID=312017 RepID=I7MJP0_TETTS|nr:hypothetical protein TTHERM_00191610 [Tetrahymena thermophila SB210]EAR96492.2 hypothetical protein TTHERM_00191610 [Tetrahymena thermophila SB210]|eukprot:XP_001016737.2 hypothetical protein TTHERM_00191610 [Tetrahymena thermophila SB210]